MSGRALRVLVQVLVFGAIIWIGLDLARAYLGREVAWVLGGILLFGIVWLIVQERKHSSSRRTQNANNMRDIA
jgi:hypothetical protein